MRIWKWLKRKVSIWLFVHHIGRMSREYNKLTQQTERASYLMQKFGGGYIDIIDQRQGKYVSHS